MSLVARQRVGLSCLERVWEWINMEDKPNPKGSSSGDADKLMAPLITR